MPTNATWPIHDGRLHQVTVARLLAEKLVDQLDHTERLARTDPIDPGRLQASLTDAMTYATCLLDELDDRGP